MQGIIWITDSQLGVKTDKENIPHGWIFASFMVKHKSIYINFRNQVLVLCALGLAY